MALILVADDDRVTRAMLTDVLEEQGHTILEAADGNETLNLCDQHKVDLIFLDIFMPGKDGIEVIRNLKTKALDHKIVAMTGGSTFTAQEPLKWAMRYGIKHTIKKPFQENVLIKLLNELLPT